VLAGVGEESRPATPKKAWAQVLGALRNFCSHRLHQFREAHQVQDPLRVVISVWRFPVYAAIDGPPSTWPEPRTMQFSPRNMRNTPTQTKEQTCLARRIVGARLCRRPAAALRLALRTQSRSGQFEIKKVKPNYQFSPLSVDAAFAEGSVPAFGEFIPVPGREDGRAMCCIQESGAEDAGTDVRPCWTMGASRHYPSGLIGIAFGVPRLRGNRWSLVRTA